MSVVSRPVFVIALCDVDADLLWFASSVFRFVVGRTPRINAAPLNPPSFSSPHPTSISDYPNSTHPSACSAIEIRPASKGPVSEIRLGFQRHPASTRAANQMSESTKLASCHIASSDPIPLLPGFDIRVAMRRSPVPPLFQVTVLRHDGHPGAIVSRHCAVPRTSNACFAQLGRSPSSSDRVRCRLPRPKGRYATSL